MGKTKERLIQIQEQMMMDWQHDMLTELHEDLEVGGEMLVKLPTRSSDTSSEPVQTIDTEAFTDDLYDMMVERIHSGSLKDILEGIVTDLLDKHGIQTGSQASLASQLRKSLDEKNLK